MCDYGRLNFDYLQGERRLLEPALRAQDKLEPVRLEHARSTHAAEQLKHFVGRQIAILASGRMTNEELWLDRAAREIARHPADRHRPAHRTGRRHSPERRSQPEHQRRATPRSRHESPGTVLHEIAEAVACGQIKALICARREPRPMRASRRRLWPSFRSSSSWTCSNESD